MIDVYRLLDAICEAYDAPEFKPSSGVTYCNQAVTYVAERVGYNLFKGLLANHMVDLMGSSRDWQEIEIKESQTYANTGRFVVAGLKDNPHGHVVVVRPGREIYSEKWQTLVPKVMNVGAKNFIGVDEKKRIMTLAWVFPGANKPKVWMLR